LPLYPLALASDCLVTSGGHLPRLRSWRGECWVPPQSIVLTRPCSNVRNAWKWYVMALGTLHLIPNRLRWVRLTQLLAVHDLYSRYGAASWRCSWGWGSAALRSVPMQPGFVGMGQNSTEWTKICRDTAISQRMNFPRDRLS
jgi:hypothetical protein